MSNPLKEQLKKILPPPVRTFHLALQDIHKKLDHYYHIATIQLKEQRANKQELTDKLSQLEQQLQSMKVLLSETSQEATEQNKKLEQLLLTLSDTGKVQQTQLQTKLTAMEKELAIIRQHAYHSERNADEAVWGEIFNNTIAESTWLTNRAFSPGRWAIGYPYLYVLYRVLNEGKPKRILELGLGQSTRMIGQYVAADPEVEHIVVEHDSNWISFFQNDFTLSEQSTILQLPWGYIPYKEAETVRVYDGFAEALEGKQFDFISIDAPLGGDMKEYARIDVLQMLPDILAEEFVIMVDDCNRQPDLHTLQEMKRVLQEHDISFAEGTYLGMKKCVILASPSKKFLTSL